MDRCTGQHRDCIWCDCVAQARSLDVEIYFDPKGDTKSVGAPRKLTDRQLDTLLLVMDLIP